jgi:hypothetical protein
MCVCGGCGMPMCCDNNNDGYCDKNRHVYCENGGPCNDEDGNCRCDWCNTIIHTNNDNDCYCDNCPLKMKDHIDTNVDGHCDLCDDIWCATLGNPNVGCIDENKDCCCDGCFETGKHVDDNKDGCCDNCDLSMS